MEKASGRLKAINQSAATLRHSPHELIT